MPRMSLSMPARCLPSVQLHLAPLVDRAFSAENPDWSPADAVGL
jgi:hypothetical protein